MEIGALSLAPVVKASVPELGQGALLRYLNEIMWFPVAALRPYLAWEVAAANTARATMPYGGVSASGLFAFDEHGDLTTMTAERYRLAGHGTR